MNFFLYSAKRHQLRQHRHFELSRGLLNIKTMLQLTNPIIDTIGVLCAAVEPLFNYYQRSESVGYSCESINMQCNTLLDLRYVSTHLGDLMFKRYNLRSFFYLYHLQVNRFILAIGCFLVYKCMLLTPCAVHTGLHSQTPKVAQHRVS